MVDKFSTEDEIKLKDVNVNKNGLDIKGTAFSSPLEGLRKRRARL